MLSNHLIRSVQKLLDTTDLSYANIARRTGVSHDSVAKIQSGKIQEKSERPEDREEMTIRSPGLKVERCLECGCVVYVPCVACSVRALMDRK